MTVEEIKAQYSMMDVVGMYGIQPDRSGFCHCPFHQGDHHGSLKIYQDNFHCYGCGANGDIFTFVELMDECGFKEAFKKLGGTYGKRTDSSYLWLAKIKAERKQREKERQRLDKELRATSDAISHLREVIKNGEPFSDEWCDAQNKLPQLLAKYDELSEQKGGG